MKYRNQSLNYLVNPSFQGVNKLFVFSFENENSRILHSEYYFPKVEIKDSNVKFDGKNFFDQTINNHIKTYEQVEQLPLVNETIKQLVVC